MTTDWKYIVLGAAIRSATLLAVSVYVDAAQAQQANAIVIKNFMFLPMAITIKAGSTVTWKNLDEEPHTVVEDTGLFRSKALDQNDSYQYTFNKPVTYKIFCGIHPTMRETIVVQ